jgi:hypothetical protein
MVLSGFDENFERMSVGRLRESLIRIENSIEFKTMRDQRRFCSVSASHMAFRSSDR